MTGLPECVLDGCERKAWRRGTPWCRADFRDAPAELRTAYIRALGRRNSQVDGADTELQVAREALDAWFAETPGTAP